MRKTELDLQQQQQATTTTIPYNNSNNNEGYKLTWIECSAISETNGNDNFGNLVKIPFKKKISTLVTTRFTNT